MDFKEQVCKKDIEREMLKKNWEITRNKWGNTIEETVLGCRCFVYFEELFYWYITGHFLIFFYGLSLEILSYIQMQSKAKIELILLCITVFFGNSFWNILHGSHVI